MSDGEPIPLPESINKELPPASLEVTHSLSPLVEKIPVDPQEFALNALIEQGFIQKDEKGSIYCDVDKFKASMDFKASIQDKLGPISRTINKSGNVVRKATIPTFLDIFRDKLVYSMADREKIEKGEKVEPRPMFYIPKNTESALSPEEIKKNKFHMGLWEFPNIYMESVYPTQEQGLKSDLLTHEAIVSALVFHPQYGNGERDSDGRLMVALKKGEKVPISSRFFESWEYDGKPKSRSNEYNPLHSPIKFLLNRCPNLVKKGVIDPWKDFETFNSPELQYPSLKKPNKKGVVMVGGINYTLGTKYSGDNNYKIAAILGNKYAGIFKETPEGELLLEKVLELGRSKDGTFGRSAGRRDTFYSYVTKENLVTLSPEGVKEKNPELQAILDNYKSYAELSERLVKEERMSLASLSVSEQSHITLLYMKYGNEPEFWNFIKKYKFDGMKTLMVNDYAGAEPKQAFELAEKSPYAASLFNEVANIHAAAIGYRDTTLVSRSPEEQQRIKSGTDIILQHAGDLLLANLPVVRGTVKAFDTLDVIGVLRNYKDSLVASYSRELGKGVEATKYGRLLDFFNNPNSSEPERKMALELLKHEWTTQMAGEGKEKAEKIQAESDKFYIEYGKKLYQQASETTGDTLEELTALTNFAHDLQQGKKLEGLVVDMGCGNGERLTKPMGRLFPNSTVVGIDRILPNNRSENNINFVQGDFTSIPLPDNSSAVVTANWSVVNDLLSRKLQMGSIAEVARVLRIGGKFRADLPHLEGGEGSWQPVAERHYRLHPDESYGTIRGVFPDGHEKEFYIYPEAEWTALLAQYGFTVEKHYWRTQSGKPRMTVVATLNEKVTPEQAMAQMVSSQTPT